ncbi:hypothetical protein ZOSMA_66G00040 [Zostera marina]|uniref:protein-serine/threonine phosphatase n=1 Tax=Zostera marina TaxID=29655 RepID=A0A0K9NS34_ZOSMR|nr:hypothetical protein ZOSMA_66G00040 [Zostera marina]
MTNDVLADLGLQDELNSDEGNINSVPNAYVSIGQYPDESCYIADDDENFSENYFTIRQSLLKAFDSMDKELELRPSIDCYCSGTTAVTLVKQGQELVIGNVGDSRAVLGYREDNSLIAIQLTVDLKPVDGVWDVFSNEQVVEIVASAPNHTKAAEILIMSAVQEWRIQYPTSKIDDCTAVCLFVGENPRQTKILK